MIGPADIDRVAESAAAAGAASEAVTIARYLRKRSEEADTSIRRWVAMALVDLALGHHRLAAEASEKENGDAA